MQDFWETLGISAISDERAIKAAYAKQLKLIDILVDPSEFQSLRDAYQLALIYASNDQLTAAQSDCMPRFNDVHADDLKSNQLEIFERADNISLLLNDLANTANPENFDFLRWLESYKDFSSIEARLRLSRRLLHEFVTTGNDWPFWLMNDISAALNWNEVRFDGSHDALVQHFYSVLDNANYVQNMLPKVKYFFAHPWNNRAEAAEALFDIIESVEPIQQSSLSYAVYQTGCAASSAWAALLTAKEVFGWNNLDYATNQVLELSLGEARFREKLYEITGDEDRAPLDTQENAIWRLRKPFDYLDGYHPMDPIARVLNLADAYGISKNDAFNPEQLKFYSDYLNGKTGIKSKIELFFANFFNNIFPTIVIFALLRLLS